MFIFLFHQIERERSKSLQEKLDALSKQLTSLLEERESLRSLVSCQKREKKQLEFENRERESGLNTRIQSLKDVVIAGQTIQRQVG